LKGELRLCARAYNHINLEPDELSRQLGKAIESCVREPIFYREILTFRVSEFLQGSEESRPPTDDTAALATFTEPCEPPYLAGLLFVPGIGIGGRLAPVQRPGTIQVKTFD